MYYYYYYWFRARRWNHWNLIPRIASSARTICINNNNYQLLYNRRRDDNFSIVNLLYESEYPRVHNIFIRVYVFARVEIRISLYLCQSEYYFQHTKHLPSSVTLFNRRSNIEGKKQLLLLCCAAKRWLIKFHVSDP